jgi:putative NIF3 family GTP cyclohydrolase 1 type 2
MNLRLAYAGSICYNEKKTKREVRKVAVISGGGGLLQSQLRRQLEIASLCMSIHVPKG